MSNCGTYDVRGRLTSYTDEVNRTTTYGYADSSTGTTVTTTYPDSPTPTARIEHYRLDGSLDSVGGTAVYGESHDHGVVAGTSAPYTAGDTWTRDAVNGGLDWTVTYYNHAGQPYLIQKSIPSTAGGNGSNFSSATNQYDNNGRLTKSVGFDGTQTLYLYDSAEGSADVVLDVNRDNVYEPFIDRKSITRFSGSSVIGKSLADIGVDTSVSTVGDNGLSASQTDNNITTSSGTVFNSDGTVTVTMSNADGTSVVDTLKHGLLLSEQNLGTNGTTVITQQTYDYDSLGRVSKVHDDAWGDTLYERRADGTVSKITYPDQRTTVYADFDNKTNAPLATTRKDTKTQNQTLNSQGQTLTQQGPGVITSKFGYHANTGQNTDLTIYRSGVLNDSTTAEHTGWSYDDYSGLLLSKTYADNTQDQYNYNAGFQLTSIQRPGQTATLGYDTAGQLVGTSYADSLYGNLTNVIAARDDAGRPLVSTQTVGGKTTTQLTAYTNVDQVKADLSGPSGAGTIYEYYPNSGSGSNTGGAAPGALKSVTLRKGDTALEQKDYAYDGTTKRLSTITLNIPGQEPQIFQYTYKSGTNLVNGVGGGNAVVDLSYEPQTGRLQSITYGDGDETTYFDEQIAGTDENSQQISGYNKNDQRKTEQVSYLGADGNPVSYVANYGYDTENTNNQHPIDALTSVTRAYGADGLSNESYSYTYDAVGNITSNNGTLAGFNNLNQNTSFTYDNRGNRISDGSDYYALTYTWDAQDHLASVTMPARDQKLEFSYDAQGRRVEKRYYSWFGDGTWTFTGVRRYTWDGDAIVAEFDGGNRLLTTYTWGIGGLAGGLLAVTDYTPTTGGPKTYRVISDATGSVVGLIDASTGAVAATYRYDPYGNLLSEDGPAAGVCNYRFAGGYRDSETGQQYHLNRYYDPASGNWLSRDPIAEAGGVNLYRYSESDPVQHVDPSGLDDVKEVPLFQYGYHIERQEFYDNNNNVIRKGINKTYRGYIIDGKFYQIAPEAYRVKDDNDLIPEDDKRFTQEWNRHINRLGSGARLEFPPYAYSGDGKFLTVWWPSYNEDLTGTRMYYAQRNFEPNAAEKVIPVYGQYRMFEYEMACGNYAQGAAHLTISIFEAATVVLPFVEEVQAARSAFQVSSAAAKEIAATQNAIREIQAMRLELSTAESLSNVGGRVGPAFDPVKLENMIAAFERQGGTVMRGEFAEDVLNYEGANAMYTPSKTNGEPGVLWLRENPTRLEVTEEFVHIGKARQRGWTKFKTFNKEAAAEEVVVQDILLNVAAKQIGQLRKPTPS